MNFRPTIWTLAICITISLAEYTPQSLVLKSSNLFAIDLYTKVAEDEYNENLIISPLVSQLGLSMTAYGARNETARQLFQALRMPIDRQKALEGYKELLTKVNNVTSLELKIASKLLVAKKSKLKPEYVNLVKEYFLSDISLLNSRPAKSIKKVNKWVTKKTDGNIRRLLNHGDIDKTSSLVILNVAYFKAKWAFEFNKDDTEYKIFYLANGTQIQVEMMYTRGNFICGEIVDLDAHYVELPFKDTGLKLVIIVPNKVTGLPDLERRIRIFPFDKIENYIEEIETIVYLPKFKIESTVDLEEPLKYLGATDMFGETADLSGITDAPLRVSKIIQKAYISVDEEGSVATAAGGATTPRKFGSEPPTPPLEADRPFYFAIRSSTSVLFEGHVLEPNV